MTPLLHPLFPGDLNEPGAVPVGLPVQVGEVRDEAARRLLLQFESLGEDCEFGLAQRRHAAEPLSLLRWANTSPAALIGLLAARFDGFGDPARTEIRAAPWGELMAFDMHYSTRMHSFVHGSGVDMDRFRFNQCRRIQFLTRKLLEELALGEKIFVYQAGDAMTDDMAAHMHELLCRFGQNRLLAVSIARDADFCGGIRTLGRGLLRGFIDRRGKTITPSGQSWNINYAAWIGLCRASMEHRDFRQGRARHQCG